MHFSSSGLRSSPTDLANFLVCRHKSGLDLLAAKGLLMKPTWEDPLAVVLRQRGQDHEAAYVTRLRAAGLRVVDLSTPEKAARPTAAEAVARTTSAMHDGADVIVQAAVGGGQWFGYADVLMRTEGASALGHWHYEAHDTKLATETRGGTILQLCVYTDLLGAIQQRHPEQFVVVTPEATHAYRYHDFAAFYRLAKSQYEAFMAAPEDIYPNPTDHCEVCAWWERCNARRRKDDHLTFVAGLGRTQQAELEGREVATLAALASVPVPLVFKPTRGAKATYEKLREQARLQNQQRTDRRPVYELLPIENNYGLCRLPEPSRGDLFLDLEGDPYVTSPASGPGVSGGREYLFGLGWVRADGQFDYRSWWATDDPEERAAFDALVTAMMGAVADDAGAHIYHFAPYEPSAMKRLMGRYALRETDIDVLLRGGRFVDLLAVVREGLRAGVESYSIKKLEPFYAFTRDVDLERAGDKRRVIELALETGDGSGVTEEVRDAVEGYNRDDVRSTLELRTWLEKLRHGLVAGGAEVPRFVSKEGEASEKVTDRQQRIEALRARLLAMPENPAAPTLQPRSELALTVSSQDGARGPTEGVAPGRARSILAYLLDWHYREDKVTWWEYFRLLNLAEEDLVDEGAAVAGLEFVGKVRDVLSKKGKPTGSEIHRYRYPPQEMDIRREADLHGRDGQPFGTAVAVDRGARTVDIFRGKTSLAEPHPTALFAHESVNADVPAGALYRFGEHVAAHGLDPDGPFAAGVSLLLGHAPRIGSTSLEAVEAGPSESASAFAMRLAPALDRTVLPIQGPPGAGKTYTGAGMICELVRQGRRVGMTATGHKVIRNLLDAVAARAEELGIAVKLGHKPKEPSETVAGAVVEFKNNDTALAALASGDLDVLGGTAWLWSRPEFAHAVDVLFVDEAGQMSLANVLAVSQATNSLVLLGDPQQLEQPQKGSHPDGVGVSALQHVLGAHQTMPPARGIFLPETWRLAPAICDFTSEVFYEGKLRPRPGRDRQCIVGGGRVSGTGLRVVEVTHDGCRNASDEEVEVVSALVDELLAPGVTWVNEAGESKGMTAADVLVVAPYNAHVGRLQERLSSRGVRVGTVDKFQGQEAPVVIYSLATSRPEDAPRGMEFLYSLNRLNVATSRAKCVCVMVANARLFEPECRTPRQMQLANALCRYREMARSPPRANRG